MTSIIEEIAQWLRARGLRIAVAESCTGGQVGSHLTALPGSSEYFLGGVIAYDNQVKVKLVGVPVEFLERHGAVSAEVALAMARGVRARLEADIGIAVTGIAGPGGATPAKPVGLTYVALSTGQDTDLVREHRFTGDRAENQAAAADALLALLHGYLQEQ